MDLGFPPDTMLHDLRCAAKRPLSIHAGCGGLLAPRDDYGPTTCYRCGPPDERRAGTYQILSVFVEIARRGAHGHWTHKLIDELLGVEGFSEGVCDADLKATCYEISSVEAKS